MTATSLAQPSRARVWLMAARPKTLAAAFVPVFVGTAVAVGDGVFSPLPALAALLGAFAIQIGTNLANDYFDFKKGADTADRLGPTRVTQAGLLSAKAVKVGTALSFLFAALVGLYLIGVGGWPILVIGVASILSGIAYTGGPYPLGYNGLGDLFVFVFFGLIAVTATYYVQALSWSPQALVAALPVGFLSTAILVVNNYRDIDTDRVAGKRTLAVRLGRRATRVQYALLVFGAFLVPLLQWAFFGAGFAILLPLLALPLAVVAVKEMAKLEGAALNGLLAATARLLAVFGVLYAVGYML